MELWFLLALVSSISAGLGSFTHKVAAMRKCDATLMATQATLLSLILLTVGLAFLADFSEIWHLSSLIGLIAGASYFTVLVLKIDVLKHIDSAIFFPIYKVLGPLITIGLGLVFFSERFTSIEWLGLILSLLVPLLLISKSENKRQQNLFYGLFLLVFAAIIGSISIAITKFGSDLSSDLWWYIYTTEVGILIGALASLGKRKNLASLAKINLWKEQYGLIIAMGVTQFFSAVLIIWAFYVGGSLGIVYMISSLYIIIPIVLSIIYYQEHWNARKIFAIILSVLALVLLK